MLAEMGYEVAQYNAAFLLDAGMLTILQNGWCTNRACMLATICDCARDGRFIACVQA